MKSGNVYSKEYKGSGVNRSEYLQKKVEVLEEELERLNKLNYKLKKKLDAIYNIIEGKDESFKRR